MADGLLARVSEPGFCEHDPDGFALWISVRPGMLLCGFCCQAARVLAEDIRSAAPILAPGVKSYTAAD